MAKNIVIVESPAKSKTLKKYLGNDFDILASYGHVRDLVPKEGAVDPASDFAMKYQVVDKNQKHVNNICSALKGAECLYLATDPDREGEAISWHLLEIIRQTPKLSKIPAKRVVFHEITKTAVINAISNPRELSMELVYAQQARRALDYLVGFNLSPLLWKKIRRGLSAGRVQSPALRMIVERDAEIEKFNPQEYWTIIANVTDKKKKFTAKLVEYEGNKLKQFDINNEQQATSAKQTLTEHANGTLKVLKVTKSKRKRNPAAPFTTSTLQQEAVRKLSFSAQRTMQIAQQLYEGIDIGDGAVGLITYMRTDSVNLSLEAVDDIRALIAERYGKENVPDTPKVYKTKSKNAQEAHEAIRPTFVNYLPSKIKNKLSQEQYKLYNLIWQRTVACQMIHATLNQVAIDFACGEGNRFRANGSTLANPGFIQVYQEGLDDGDTEDEEKLLPPLAEGDEVDLREIVAEQHFTEPPPRYSEATLVKSLEEHGIGRPSTYASIISTLRNREYVNIEQRRFFPTDVGKIVNKFLTTYFTKYVDYNFTARLEDSLDEVSRGEKDWIPLLETFWTPFIDTIKYTQDNVSRQDVTQEKIDEKCPECGSQLSIRLGKRGKFIGCTAFPDCSYTRSLDSNAEDTSTPEIVPDRKCPKCDSDLVIKTGKYGKFIGCSSYPNCKFIESLDKPVDTKITCPSCNEGSLIKRKSRYGTYFYACSAYPKCKYSVKHPPVVEECPQCSWPILTIKSTKRSGIEKICPQKDCGYTVSASEAEIPDYS